MTGLSSFGNSRLQTEARPAQSFALIKADNGIKYKDVESSVEQSAAPPFIETFAQEIDLVL